MLCRPCFCAHRIPYESTAAYASRSGLANTYCTFPRYNCLPHATQANGNPWRRHMLKNDWAAHAKQQLWNIVCQPDPEFQKTIHRLAGNNDVQPGSWHQQGGRLTREEQYIKSLKKNSVGPTEAFCIDQQQCIHQSNGGFAVRRKVYTPKVPFGGSFHNLVHWCACSEEGSGKVRLQISCDVIFTNRWLPAKGIITSSSIEGMKEYYSMWLQELYHYLNFPNSPGQSVDALPPSGKSQPKLKISPHAITGSANASSPYVILLLKTLWQGRSEVKTCQGSQYLHA